MNRFFKIFTISTMVLTIGFISLQGQVRNPLITTVVSADSVQDAVIQQNISKMEHINSYSAEFVVDYVAPSRDYDEVVNTLNQIQELSNSICENLTSTYEKIKSIHDYVCETLSYDHVASENTADFNTICLKNVLVNHRSICAGYSNLFSALCNAQGIYCVNIRGSAVNNNEVTYENLADDDTVTNHEWTAVWYDEESRWIYVDCTWDSQNHYYGEDDISINPLKYQYFDISVEELSKNHKAKIVDYRNFLDAINYFDLSTTIDISDTTTSTTDALTSTTDTQKQTTSSINTTTSDTLKPIDTAENTSNKGVLHILICGTIAICLAKIFSSKN